jgi:hypothetical protein
VYFAGQQFAAGFGLSTMHPSLDWETYSEAGYVWNATEQKWQSPRGCGTQTRGLKAVGVYNYVMHPTFRALSLAYDLLDGGGMRHWVPVYTEFGLADEPHDIIAHVAARRTLAAWNVGFEMTVWNLHFVRLYGWPYWDVEYARCDMAKAQVSAYPAALDNAGELLLPEHLRKDKAGAALVRKLTVPKNPSKARAKPAAAQASLFYPHAYCLPEHECAVCFPFQTEHFAEARRNEKALRIGEAVLDAIGENLNDQTYAASPNDWASTGQPTVYPDDGTWR